MNVEFRGPTEHRSRGILHSGSKAQDKREFRNHGFYMLSVRVWLGSFRLRVLAV